MATRTTNLLSINKFVFLLVLIASTTGCTTTRSLPATNFMCGWTMDIGRLSSSGCKVETFPPGDGRTSYFIAPAQMMGDWRGFAVLRFDKKSSGGNYYEPHIYGANGDVIIMNGDLWASHDIPQHHDGTWRTFTVPLNDGQWVSSGGAPLSEFLRNVTTLKIRAEYGAGTDRTSLSNVELRTPAILDVRDVDTPGADSVLHVGGLTDGVSGFVDRAYQHWINVPESLEGADYIESAQDNADVSDDRGSSLLIEVDVAGGAVLYMFIDENLPVTPFRWMNLANFGADWVDTGLDISWPLDGSIFDIWRTVGPLDAGTYKFRQMPVDSSFYGIAATFTAVPVTIDIKTGQARAQAETTVSGDISPELIEAAEAGNTAKVEELLTQGVDVNARTDYGFTALMSAAQGNHTGIVEILIDAGADVNLKNKDDFTALMYAASRGHTGTVKALMDAGANANVQAALGLAAGQGHTETVKAFTEAGVDVNAKHKSRVPLLSWAARRGHTETVMALIDAGADVNRKHTTGWTALMFAAYEGYKETAKVLIDAGADVNAKDNSGQTALMFAAETDHTEIVEILKRAGAQAGEQAGASTYREINAKLVDAALAGNTAEVEQLLKQGVDANAKLKTGFTALMGAARKGHTETAKALIDAGADVNAKDINIRTALTAAAYRGHTETVKVLIESGADVNAKTGVGGTALMDAALSGHTETLKVLIKSGAHVITKDKDGRTALMAAAHGGYTETLKVLIEAGADVNTRDKAGKTALTWASQKSHTEIVDILKRADARLSVEAPSDRMSIMEWNTDRRGLDYQSFDLTQAQPEACQKACKDDPRCKAWTYVKPNTIQGPKPRCWLKYAKPPQNQHTCCVSGTRLQ